MNKETFRKVCIERVKSNKRVNSYKLDKDINTRLYQLIRTQKSKNIMLYVPLKIEVNISSLILKLRREKKSLLVPFMEGESFSLVKYRLPLSSKKFGVKEPKNINKYKHKIDLAIVPVIGTDGTLRRVGFGKGFYDRFFEKNHKRIYKIVFVGREYCVSSKIITDDYDVKGSMYFTSRNCHEKNYLKRKLRI